MYKPKTMFQCKKCGDKIYSRYSGEFRTCTCGAIFIDETEYYCRYGKTLEDAIECELDEREFVWTDISKKPTKIKDLTESHMQNILIYLDNALHKGYMYDAIKNELDRRLSERKDFEV